MRYATGVLSNAGRAGLGTSEAFAPPEEILFPTTIPGLQAWVSTTHGEFLFGDDTTVPAHNKAIVEARDVVSGGPVFIQSTAALRPFWDSTALGGPAIRYDGSRALVRATALPAPGLVIIGCALGTPVGPRALTGARSTVTPGGDLLEDAWHLTKHSPGQMRGLVSTTTGQVIADAPELAIIGERLLVVMQMGNLVRTWHVGDLGLSSSALGGNRIASDAEQVLGAKYYADALAAFLDGYIFEFAQYAPSPSSDQRRQLIRYFQTLLWPGVSPPGAATVNAGNITVGGIANVNVIAPSSGASLVLASIDDQPAAGVASVSGSNVAISVPAGSVPGTYRTVYCLRSNVPGSRMVDFGQVDFTVTGGGAPVELPYMGQYYGCGYCGPGGAANTQYKASSDEACSQFFFAERTGLIDRITWQVRLHDGSYSGGALGPAGGGTYTVEIRMASATTKRAILPLTDATLISRVTGFRSGNTAENSSVYPNLEFTERPGQTVINQPYVAIWRNTSTATGGPGVNYASDNVSMTCNFGSGGPSSGSAQPPNYQEPAGVNPAAVGSVITPVSGWSPVIVDGKPWYTYPLKSVNGLFMYNRIGPMHMMMRYANGQWVSYGAFPAGGGPVGRTATLHAPAQMARERFRVTRASRTVSGVFIRIVRMDGTTGTLTVRLERGPENNDHFPAQSAVLEVLRSVDVPHTQIINVGPSEEVSLGADRPPGTTLDHIPWIWVPFPSPQVLALGTTYNLRLSVSVGLQCELRCVGRMDSPPAQANIGGPHGAAVATWSDWAAQRQIPWGAWEDSRGFQVSVNSGVTWSYLAAELSPILFKCV